MTWGQKIVLAGMAGMQGLDTPELQLRSTDIISLLCIAMQYYHACMFRSVCGMLKLLCPSVVALE